MSWSVSAGQVAPGTSVDTLEAELRAAIPDYVKKQGAETQEQVDACIAAAVLLAPVVGGTNVRVSLNGHATPNHGGAPGTANDLVSVHVGRD